MSVSAMNVTLCFIIRLFEKQDFISRKLISRKSAIGFTKVYRLRTWS